MKGFEYVLLGLCLAALAVTLYLLISVRVPMPGLGGL